MLLLVIGFVVFMDVLKYGFGIDPTQDERDALQKNKMKKNKVERPKVPYRYQYVN